MCSCFGIVQYLRLMLNEFSNPALQPATRTDNTPRRPRCTNLWSMGFYVGKRTECVRRYLICRVQLEPSEILLRLATPRYALSPRRSEEQRGRNREIPAPRDPLAPSSPDYVPFMCSGPKVGVIYILGDILR